MRIPQRLSADQARKNFSEMIDRAAFTDSTTIITKHGEDRAAVISVNDLRYYKALQDFIDNAEADKALADYETHGGVKWEDVKRELGID